MSEHSGQRQVRSEVAPPWITYPGCGPGDGFWRQSGEPWWTQVWQPFWESLDERAQREYLVRWAVPDEWQQFHFDRDFREWLEEVDDDD